MSLLKNERTLEVTVQKLIEAVNNHYDVDRVLADFGIRVLGVVNYTGDIPGYPDNRPTEAERHAFGDAYLVSVNSDGTYPYDTYIWTRVDPDSDAAGTWLNIGQLNAVGPQGPQGPKGDKGNTGESSTWYATTGNIPSAQREGDMWLNTATGVVSRWSGSAWVTYGSIKGPTGATGANGQTPYIQNGMWYINGTSTGVVAEGKDGADGLPGSALQIVAKLSSIDLLPSPETVERNYAYLVDIGTEERLYFLVGTDSLSWDYIVFDGNGTVVTTNGVGVSSWETNTKVDKTTVPSRTYVTDSTGINYTIGFGASAVANTMCQRYTDGRLEVGTPVLAGDATTKRYVDNLAATKLDKKATASTVYGNGSDGSEYMIQYQARATPFSLAYRYTDGRVEVGTPVGSADAANKAYVDNLLEQRGPYHTNVRTWTTTNSSITLRYSDLTDIVPGTKVHVTVYTSGTFSSAPSIDWSIGNQTILQKSNLQGIPYLYNNGGWYDIELCTDTNGNFFVNYTDQDGRISGTSFTAGLYQDGSTSTTQITVQYLQYT